MRINGNHFDTIRPERAAPVAPIDPNQQRNQETTRRESDAPRSDSVEISSAGRSLSQSALEARSNLDPERVAELRTKVLTGAYNTLDMVDHVARRILSRGDL